MVFSSIVFLFYFLPAVLLLYFASPAKYRNFILFAASLLFYSWGEPVYLSLMLLSVAMNYAFGRLLARHPRFWLILGCTANVAFLAFFKYADFLIENVNQMTGAALPLPHIPLPLGISFYTFQAMSYVIDVYRHTAQPQKSILSFGTYIALFPQLIAGPIVRYSTIAQQLSCRRITAEDLSSGAALFCCGLAKKVLLANSAGALFDQMKGSGSPVSALTAWLGILAFTFQIYFDFSGYSDMAVGLGRILGFTFPRNFDYPYVSRSITEFWHRWHITLSTWFKEYVYIPLGGNRLGSGRQICNLMVVWLLTGIWHGASWNFLVWGLYFGLLLILEKLVLSRWLSRLPRWFGHLYTMLLVMISWVVFSMDDLPSAASCLASLTGTHGWWDESGLYLLRNCGVLFLVLALASTPLPAHLWNRLTSGKGSLRRSLLQSAAIFASLVLVTANLVSTSYNPFLYFRF